MSASQRLESASPCRQSRPAEQVTALLFLNTRFTLAERASKVREEMLEACLEISRDVDGCDPRTLQELRPETVAEIADTIVTLDSLVAHSRCGPQITKAVDNAYRRLSQRIQQGEFD